MKTMFKSVSLLAAAITLAACQQQDTGTTEEEVALDTSQARLSYGVALGLGRNMANDGLAVDVDAFALGLRDALSGAEQRLTEEEIREEMMAFQERITAERQAQQSAVADANAQAAEAFLTTNGAREGVVTTESGLQYEVLEAGDGAVPGPTDQVQVHYRGTLVDGTEFDSSYSRGQPLTFGVNQVIPGWTEGLQLMNVGSKYKLFIPSELGYGAAGSGQIPPNAALVFEVELLDIPSQQSDSEEG